MTIRDRLLALVRQDRADSFESVIVAYPFERRLRLWERNKWTDELVLESARVFYQALAYESTKLGLAVEFCF